MARDFDIADAGFTARFKKQQGGVFLEDKEVLEAQQRSLQSNSDLKLTAYRIDEGGVRARQIIARAINAGQERDHLQVEGEPTRLS
jgi:vanillate O-demethylase monooxygenase subunit